MQHDRQRKNNLTLWRVRLTIFAMEVQQYDLSALLSYMLLSTI
jgi:hypothetical protein